MAQTPFLLSRPATRPAAPYPHFFDVDSAAPDPLDSVVTMCRAVWRATKVRKVEKKGGWRGGVLVVFPLFFCGQTTDSPAACLTRSSCPSPLKRVDYATAWAADAQMAGNMLFLEVVGTASAGTPRRGSATPIFSIAIQATRVVCADAA